MTTHSQSALHARARATLIEHMRASGPPLDELRHTAVRRWRADPSTMRLDRVTQALRACAADGVSSTEDGVRAAIAAVDRVPLEEYAYAFWAREATVAHPLRRWGVSLAVAIERLAQEVDQEVVYAVFNALDLDDADVEASYDDSGPARHKNRGR
jgi:hypothetical protein